MPIYDYVCAACGHRWEVFHGLNESGPHQCPLCAGRVSRAFAPPTIHFKGSGWARLDRRASARPKRSTGGEPAADPAASATGEPAAGATGGSSPAAGTGED